MWSEEEEPSADICQQNLNLTENEPFIKGWFWHYKTKGKRETTH